MNVDGTMDHAKHYKGNYICGTLSQLFAILNVIFGVEFYKFDVENQSRARGDNSGSTTVTCCEGVQS